MKRIVLLLVLYFSALTAFATPQWYWRQTSNGNAQYAVSEHTCAAVMAAWSKDPSRYRCQNRNTGVLVPVGGEILTTVTYNFYNTYYNDSELNVIISYGGPAPDKCDPPRYTGPDTSKPVGSQCTRTACVEGDDAGVWNIKVGYVNEAGDMVQRIQWMADAIICVDGCNARMKLPADPGFSLECLSGPVINGVALSSCSGSFKDTDQTCTTPYDPTAPPAPYDPNTPPPPPPPTCGGAGQPACPPPPPVSTCGGTGQPACYPGGTCGAAGQPACSGGDGSGPGGTSGGGGGTGGGGTTTTCGGVGQPVCAPSGTCGGTGQPACGTGDGSGTAGDIGECGGLNEPACTISGDGVPSGAGIGGDLAGLKEKNLEGRSAIEGFDLGSLVDWFPQFPTASCVNPQIPNPISGAMVTMSICTYVDALALIVSAIISFFFMLGSVRTIQETLKA